MGFKPKTWNMEEGDQPCTESVTLWVEADWSGWDKEPDSFGSA